MQQPKRPSQKGLEFEERLADKLGLDTVPGSGNGKFWKLDVEGFRLLISAKWTAAKSYRLCNKDIDEAIDAAKGLGGKSQDTIPLVVAEIEGREIACLPLDELIGLIQEEAKLLPSNDSNDRYATTNVPALLRKENHQDK